MPREKKKKAPESSGEGAPLWMISFADMVSLLMTFFILLASMVDLNDSQKLRVALGALAGSIGVMAEGIQTEKGKKEILSALAIIKANPDDNLIFYHQLQSLINTEAAIKVLKVQAGFVLRISSSILFEVGDDTLKIIAHDKLKSIIKFLEEIPFDIRIEGHTDDQPLSSKGKFATNWDLSVARAIAVTAFIVKNSTIPKEKIAISGYGDSRPITENDTEENRLKNRRVDILLVSPEGVLTLN